MATYFRNKPPRGVGGKPTSLPFGEKLDISIAACAEDRANLSGLYHISHHISALQRQKGRDMGQNATECCFVAAPVSVILAKAGR
jgi:hypothetical protein